METAELQKNLTELYRLTLDYEFRKNTYENRMTALKENYAEILKEIARICDEDEAQWDAAAGCVPEYIVAELEKEPSRRKRGCQILNHKMNLVTWFIPLMGEAPSLNAERFAGRVAQIWNERMPEEKIGTSTYDSIKNGFSKGPFCFITTAVCRTMDRPDDCYELTLLRKYRDGYLMSSEEGRRLVQDYYNIAPTIVKRIDREPDAGEIYRKIWTEYLCPCIGMIENGDQEACRDKYTEMVRKLEKEYFYLQKENDR